MRPERREVKEWLKTVDREELRDKLADRDRDLQTANFNLSQVAQTSAIVGRLRPYPIPAYVTASPYQSITTGGTTTT